MRGVLKSRRSFGTDNQYGFFVGLYTQTLEINLIDVEVAGL